MVSTEHAYILLKNSIRICSAQNMIRVDLTDESYSPTGADQTLVPAECTHVNHVPIYLVHGTFPRVLFFDVSQLLNICRCVSCPE